MKKLKGFSHSYSTEKIKKYMLLSPKEKLRWLEEINNFMLSNMPQNRREAWQRLRKGNI